MIPKAEDVINSYSKINSIVNKTPILTSSYLNELSNCQLYFKCENFQKVGAFKYRGASNAILNLNDSEKSKGVATHSSGNHAQALALAAKNQGVKARIVMPSNAPKVKYNAVIDYGAEVTLCEPTLEARESNLNDIISNYGSTFIHPFDNPFVIAGQGTSSLELLNEVNDIDIIITPVGGGGLLSGTAIYSKYHNPDIIVIGAEPLGANDAFKSFKSKKLIPSTNPNTICDGLLTSLSERTFSIILDKVDNILLVDDNEIKEAMKLVWQRMKILIEPSSATVLAVVLKYSEFFNGKKVALIISGGNFDIDHLI